MIIEAIKIALNAMDKRYCKLSKLNYREFSSTIVEKLKPFAYEFYHQFRKLIEEGKINFDVSFVIQPEVNKTYQYYFEKGKILDFIIHIPNSSERNLAVIEFKVTDEIKEIIKDLRKFLIFKKVLNYEYLIEVLIGESEKLSRIKRKLRASEVSKGTEVIIIESDVSSWKASSWILRVSKTRLRFERN